MRGPIYAVSGAPVATSSSPHLFRLVLAHLFRQGVVDADPRQAVAAWIEATTCAEALAALEGLAHGPLDAQHGSLALEVAGTRPSPVDVPARRIGPDSSRWMSLTSPLKHDLGAWTHLDESAAIRSVNTLRVEEGRVLAMTTDGQGVVQVADALGLGPRGGGVLALRGGGGAARSTAQAWCSRGGRLHLSEGRRPLDLRPEWSLSDEASAGFGVNFDADGHDLLCDTRLEATYRCGAPSVNNGKLGADVVDGRWMLVAQHLEAWRACWAPHVADLLPKIEVLVEDLLEMERRWAHA